MLWTKTLPSLGWLSTTKLTFGRPKGARIATSITITTGIRSPIPSNALSINPYLPFPHTTHVYGQWLITFWGIEISLQLKCNQKLQWSVTDLTQKSYSICNTLCQVSGCCLCAINDASIQSTDEMLLGELRLIASPLSPTCSRRQDLGNF